MILVPVKRLSGAKQRLASLLDQTARTQLAEAMLADVLDAVRGCRSCEQVGLVTSDPYAQDLARKFGFEIIPDAEHSGETAAIEMATGICRERGVPETLVIPGDIPLLQSSELEDIFRAAPDEGSVLVPAGDGRGTNAALQRPAGLFPLRFGNDSFKPHLAAAKATGQPCIVLRLPGIALDVDNPSDVQRLAELPGKTRAQRLVREWRLSELPAAASQ